VTDALLHSQLYYSFIPLHCIAYEHISGKLCTKLNTANSVHTHTALAFLFHLIYSVSQTSFLFSWYFYLQACNFCRLLFHHLFTNISFSTLTMVVG